MYQFGNPQGNQELNYFAGVFNQLQAYRSPPPHQNQRILENLKQQTQSLVSEVSSLKQVFKDFVISVKQTLDQMSSQVVAIKKAAETERPKKKFKKAIMCPNEDCGRKYSSKIALNCHIRNKHPCLNQ